MNTQTVCFDEHFVFAAVGLLPRIFGRTTNTKEKATLRYCAFKNFLVASMVASKSSLLNAWLKNQLS